MTVLSSGRGRVVDPLRDGRLRANRDAGTKISDSALKEVVPNRQGRVKHPETDKRLKQNRKPTR